MGHILGNRQPLPMSWWRAAQYLEVSPAGQRLAFAIFIAPSSWGRELGDRCPPAEMDAAWASNLEISPAGWGTAGQRGTTAAHLGEQFGGRLASVSDRDNRCPLGQPLPTPTGGRLASVEQDNRCPLGHMLGEQTGDRWDTAWEAALKKCSRRSQETFFVSGLGRWASNGDAWP